MTQDPDLQYKCEECGETFDTEVELEQHNRKVHSRYTCDIFPNIPFRFAVF